MLPVVLLLQLCAFDARKPQYDSDVAYTYYPCPKDFLTRFMRACTRLRLLIFCHIKAGCG